MKALRGAGIDRICLLRLGPGDAQPSVEDPLLTLRGQARPTGAAGCLLELAGWLRGSPMLVVFGSTYLHPQCVRHLIRHAKARSDLQAAAGIVTTEADDKAPLETVCIDAGGALRRISNRHRSEDRRNARRFAGLFLFSNAVLSHIPPECYFELKEQLLPALLEQGIRIDTVPLGRSRPVVSPEDYLRTQFQMLDDVALFAEDAAPQRREHPSDVQIRGRVALGHGSRLGQGARIFGPVLIGEGCSIAADSVIIGPAVLGARCRLGRASVVHCSVLEDEAALGDEAQAAFSLLGRGWSVPPRRKCQSVDERDPRQSRERRWAPPGTGWSVRQGSPRALRARRRITDTLKRAIDVVLASVVLAAAAPLMMLIACAIKLDSPGPVFFRQRRCGRYGKEFPMLKFRSMVVGAERLQKDLRRSNAVDGPTFKLVHDPRVTPLGQFLRRTSLDELPQLLNVIAGHMSLVGPRPLVMREMSVNAHWRDSRLSVRPGITGLWQVEARSDSHFYRWVELDVRYAREQSLLLDLKILLRTVAATMKGM